MEAPVNLADVIPNNVHLGNDKTVQRALEEWRPRFLDWWRDVGPQGFSRDDIYLRTATSVGDGWADFGHVKMPDYRWGILLAPPEPDRKIPFGDNEGRPTWQELPGEFRNTLRNLITTQGDTEPGSVEQQRRLGATAPSLYDLRNLFQVNVEEGRHLWAMVYLLHKYHGKDGRDEADGLLERRSGDPDKPRRLGAFNNPIDNWLDFFMFTMFTDRDGKYQLGALAESGFDPLSRTCRFMLTEEAHHLFVGETGISRIVQRTCELMNQDPNEDARVQGGIDLPTVQRYINQWVPLSRDLFGSEQSTNAADFFAAGLKGRYKETEQGKYPDHRAEGDHTLHVVHDGAIGEKVVPLRNALNDVLRGEYDDDCQRAVNKWNGIIEKAGLKSAFRLTLPSVRFNRSVGLYSGHSFDPEGNLIALEEFSSKRGEWLPTKKDAEYVASLMQPVHELGKIANWIAPPSKGINGQPFDFEYVRRAA